MTRGGPGLATALHLMVGLRLRLARRQLGGSGWIGAVVGVLLLGGLAALLGLGSYLLLTRLPALEERIWLAFALGLLSFLLSLFWVTWPVIAAQIEESSELGRYLHLPVSPARLYLVQTIAALGEPGVLFFFPALLGISAAMAVRFGLDPGLLAVLAAAFVWMNVAVGRTLQIALLNVLRSRQSAEWLLTGFLLALGVAAAVPPVDASWLFERLATGEAATADDLREIAVAADALADTPPGWFGYALRAAVRGHAGTALKAAVGMVVVGALAWVAGLALVQRFYRGARGRRRAPTAPATPAAPRAWTLPGLAPDTAAVADRELRTLWRNPKVRMLVAMPFFLVLLLRIFGAGWILRYGFGPPWAAVLVTLLVGYALAVASGPLLANAFGYDGPAVRLVFLLPARPGAHLVGRNVAHAVLLVGESVLLGALVVTVLPGATLRGMALPAAFLAIALPVLLGLGNRLSVAAPRRSHLSLTRRDRPPPLAAAVMLLALAACGGLTSGLQVLAVRLGLPSVLLLWPLPLLGAVFYRHATGRAAAHLVADRERLISAVARG
jgi:hypothetical protein